MSRCWLLLVLVVATTAARQAEADELTEEESALQVHGFLSQGALWTTDNNYLAQTEDGSFEFAEAGIAFSKQLDPKLRAGFQLFTRDLGWSGTYSAKFDWFNLDYRWRDWLGVRAGRTKIPFGLYNESLDIDAAQPVVLLPQSVYSASNREFLLAQTGVELYGYRRLGALGALDYRAFGGTIYLTVDSTPTVRVDSVTVPYIVGARVMWELPVTGLRVGASAIGLKIKADLVQADTPIEAMVTQEAWVASLEYAVDRLTFSAEYGRAHSRQSYDIPLPPAEVTSESMYAMASYRWSPLVQPTLYYSLQYPNVDHRDGKELRQHDAALAFRFDLTPNWLLKLEGHAMRGTAALTADLNDGVAPAALANRWWLLAAKTTVYF